MSIRVLDSLFAGLTCLLIILPGQLQASPDRPNILWLIVEDMGPEIACYGTPEVRTPHLDRLAATGVRFATAFTVTPVCSTSRSSFMTGMYASTIGAHQHRSHRGDGFKLPKGVRLLSHQMRDTGYFTANLRQFPEPPEVLKATQERRAIPNPKKKTNKSGK